MTDDITYTFITSNKKLLKNHLNYIKNTLIPSYKSEGYTAELLFSDKNSFQFSTNSPYVFNSDKLGNYTYKEIWTSGNTLIHKQIYNKGDLVY